MVPVGETMVPLGVQQLPSDPEGVLQNFYGSIPPGEFFRGQGDEKSQHCSAHISSLWPEDESDEEKEKVTIRMMKVEEDIPHYKQNPLHPSYSSSARGEAPPLCEKADFSIG